MRRMTQREAINIFKERIILAEHNGYADEIADYIKAMKDGNHSTEKAGKGQ